MVGRDANAASLACVHLDCDGARHIYRLHGWRYDRADDPLFMSGLAHALEMFEAASVTATLFVIAEDLDDASKRSLLRDALRAGHEIASHSMTHAQLSRAPRAVKKREIVESRDRIAQCLGVDVSGFRAPNFSLDRECLEIAEEAGYAYDSSMIARSAPPLGCGPGRVAADLRGALPGSGLLEVPMPAHRPLPLPFHPSYSLVLGNAYFRLGASLALRAALPFVLLYHLTDFAEPLPGVRRPVRRLYTLSHRNGATKRALCRRMLQHVLAARTPAPTSRIVAAHQALEVD